MPLPLLDLNHIALATRWPEESERFYCEVMGFVRLARPPFSFRGSWLRGAGVTLHLIENQALDPAAAGEISSRHNHLAFSVASVDLVKQELTERGIAFREQVNAGGARQIFFRDPDGNYLEVAVYPIPTGQEPLAAS